MTHRGPFQPLLFCDSVILWDLIPHCLLSTCPFSLVTPPGLLHQDPEAGMSSSVLACWENCTPALRTGHPQPRRQVGFQHRVSQRLTHCLRSQEAQGGSRRTRHSNFWPAYLSWQGQTNLPRMSRFHGTSIFWCENCSINDFSFFQSSLTLSWI